MTSCLLPCTQARSEKDSTLKGKKCVFFGIKFVLFRFYSKRKKCALLIMKTRLYNFVSLKPHFYIVKLEFTGVYIIFLLLLKTDCGYSLELPH